MHSIARNFAGVFLLTLLTGLPQSQADQPKAAGRGAKAANTGNSDRGIKTFGLFAEPSVGYGYGKYSQETPTGTSASSTLTGLVFSGMFGAVYTSYFGGLRVGYEMLSGGGLSGLKDLALGIEAGMTLASSPMRVFGTFNFIDNLDNAGTTISANSFIIGLSYFVSPKIVVNLEYHLRDFSRVPIAGVATKPNFSNFVLTLSLPLMFGTPSMPDMARQSSSELKEVGGAMGEWNI